MNLSNMFLRFIHDYYVINIEVHVNANGWECYDKIDVDLLETRIKSFLPDAKAYRAFCKAFFYFYVIF